MSHPLIETWILESADDLERRLEEAIAPTGMKLQLTGERVWRNEYFDTEQRRLCDEGISLLLRSSADECELRWCVSADDATIRDVVLARQTLRRRSPSSRKWPQGSVVLRLYRAVGNEPLSRQVQVDTHRKSYSLRHKQRTVLEVSFDHKSIHVDVQTSSSPELITYCELSIVGEIQNAAEFASALNPLQSSLPLITPRLSEAQRAQQLLGPPAEHRTARKLKNPSLSESASSWLERYFRRQIAALRYHESRAWEGIDPEGVHQMRVATRRMRAALKAFSGAFASDCSERVREELRWLAAVLGGVRDCDVAQMDMPQLRSRLSNAAQAAIAPYLEHMISGREDARRELLEALSSERYATLVQLLEDGSCGESADSFLLLKEPAQTVRDLTDRLLKRRLKKVVTGCSQLSEQSPPAEFHRLRIQGKRLRYLLEMIAPACRKQLKPLIRATKTMQDILGDHQDACVGMEHVDEFAQRTPMRVANRPLLLALGELRSCYHQQALDRRHTFGDAQLLFSGSRLTKQLLVVLRTDPRENDDA